MMNLEIYEKDPRTHTLLNQGVAKVTSGQSSAELDTLRYELTNFVCDGQYAEGLSRILSTYLGHLDKSEQPGVWVSGFFGSGKSHLVKMLQYLWTDFEFEDGAKARGLAKLPTGVKDLLKELTNSAKRHGGLHAAAGDLRTEAKESIRLALLGILFKSVGLPGDYTRACFQMWLRDEGLESGVREFITDAGGTFEKELTNLYVSDLMAKAILAASPGVRSQALRRAIVLEEPVPARPQGRFDRRHDRPDHAGRRSKRKAPVHAGRSSTKSSNTSAMTLDRSKAVQDVKEQCCARLGANFLLVGTGQNALSGTALLQRLQGRFPVTVELQDTDVEQVTREVVLKKKPTAEAGLKKLLDDHSGEIERQLASTKIAFSSRDRGLLVQDYPILPVRRRFWERVLRAVDKAGHRCPAPQPALGRLRRREADRRMAPRQRRQRRVHLRRIDQELGPQVGDAASGNLRNHRQAEEGRRRRAPLPDLCLDFPDRPAPAQQRAARCWGSCRRRYPGRPARHRPDQEQRRTPQEGAGPCWRSWSLPARSCRSRTSTGCRPAKGSEWNQAYLEARNRLLNDAGKLASERSQLLTVAVQRSPEEVQARPRRQQGIRGRSNCTSATSRRQTDGSAIPVWVRDGWEVEEKTVLDDARAAGDSAAVVYGYIPKKMAEELKQAIAGYYAATTTLQAKGTPSGDEGIQARKAMETRQEQSQRTRDDAHHRHPERDAGLPRRGRRRSAGRCSTRRFRTRQRCAWTGSIPLFHQADSADWHKVIDRAKKGDGDALAAVGHKGDPENHPVCKAILDYVGSGKKGTDVRKQFGGAEVRLAAGRHRRRPDRAVQRRGHPGPHRGRTRGQGQAGPEEHRRRRVPGRDDHAHQGPTHRAPRPVQEDRPEHASPARNRCTPPSSSAA